MQQWVTTQTVNTTGKRLYEITEEVRGWVKEQPVSDGMLTLYVRHTSASLTIQENDDPEVQDDLNDFFNRLVPEDDSLYTHTYEGVDDMPAHIRSALTQTSLSIPVLDGAPALWQWQGIYLFEHRAAEHTRSVVLHLLGDTDGGLRAADS